MSLTQDKEQKRLVKFISTLSPHNLERGELALKEYVDTAVNEANLKSDIKYHTLKAKYQRVFLGGEESAIPTKRYVKKLKTRLRALQSNITKKETE